jgi:O-antigen ligase
LDLWRDCFDVMVNHPLFGVGPDQWPFVAPQYGWSLGKEAHSLWFQTGAEVGFVGVLLLLVFYGTCVRRLWGLAREKGSNKNDTMDPWLRDVARMVVASVLGFMIAAQFVTVEGLEIPYYVVLIGAGALKLLSPPKPVSEGVPSPHRSPSWPLAVRRT